MNAAADLPAEGDDAVFDLDLDGVAHVAVTFEVAVEDMLADEVRDLVRVSEGHEF